MSHTLHVISHSHWDREWYLTFQQFRLRLVDLIDHLLEILDRDPDFRYFNLDAQTIVLEDYLQIRPHARSRLERYIREGRITVGPWYQLNDQFLTSGEATVRSLLVGHRIAQSFGAVLKVGYLPDQFGNLSQMPQILQGFGIDNAIVGRGYQLVDDRKMEFWWEAPDGSRVLTSLLAFWYNNAQRLPSDTADAVAYLEALRNRMAPRSATSHLLLMNGVDHLEAQPDAGQIVRAANEELERRGSGERVLHSTLAQYVEALREQVTREGPALEVKTGELREDRGGACLAGTLSSRMYLKQANHRCQIALEQYAERLAAFARIDGTAYPYDQLLYTWKLLMQNHPHDSICGCSVDQVHREMMPRFEQVEQVAEELTERALTALSGRDPTRGAGEEDTELLVFNTLNWTRTDPVVTTLEFSLGVPTRGNPPRDDSRQVRGFTLLDPDGNEVPFAVTKIEPVIRQVLNPHELNLDQWVQRVTIEFVAHDVPACGYKTYTIALQPSWPKYPETDAWGKPLCDSYYFEDSGDVGDEYLHRKPPSDEIQRYIDYADAPTHEERNTVRHTGTYGCVWALPAAVLDGQRRAEELVECRFRTRLKEWTGVPRVEFEIEFDNRVGDHRLRVVFHQWWLEDVEQSLAEGQYDVSTRPLHHPLASEGALPFHPQQFWVALAGTVRDPNDGDERPQTLTVANRGLPEYEVIPAEYEQSLSAERADPAVAVTLLRCVGQLSGRGDGPGTPTPDAQCQSEHTFHLAVMVTDGDWKAGRVWQQAHQFNVPLVTVQAPPDPEWEAVRSFVTVEPAALVVTAFKRAEDRDTLVLRFFNITDEPVIDARIALPGARRVRLVTLNEEPLDEWRDGETLTLDVGAKKIVTVEWEV